MLFRWRIGARTLKFVIPVLDGQIGHTVQVVVQDRPTEIKSLITGGNGATDFI